MAALAKRAGASLCACMHTQSIREKAGPFSVARPNMDLRFHNRFAYNRDRLLCALPTPTRTNLSSAADFS